MRPVSPTGWLFEAMIFSFPNAASETPPAESEQGEEGGRAEGLGERTFFDDAGILVCRPGGRRRCRLAAALKGGHNAEHHNHNDVGSYVAVVGSEPVLLDSGGEVYTSRTFSGRRYESKILNSWGHPVPVIGGALQRTNGDARGREEALQP